MNHPDIWIAIAIAIVLLFVLRFFAKMVARTVKWGLYGLIIVAAVIYVAVRVG